MSSRPTDDLKYFELTGPVNVVRTSPRKLKGQWTLIYILMGPTGSGKSAFIESLSDGTLSISKDSLESVTQEVVCYQVVNLKHRYNPDSNIILMDTPGFLDTKLSESRIATMIRRTLEQIHQSAWLASVYVIYFHPITDIRLGASKRDTARLLTAFAESFDVNGINVATTMWNKIHSPKKLADAENRLVALQAEIFQSSPRMAFLVNKFEFSRESALLIMDNVQYDWYGRFFRSTNLFRTMAHDNLLNRICQVEQQLQLLAEDRIHATTPGAEDYQLLETIDSSQKTVTAAHASFLTDLYDLNPAAYQSNFPNLPFPPPSRARPRPPPPPPPHRSFITRFQQLTHRVPFRNVFKKH